MTIIHPKYLARNYPLILNRVICRFMVPNKIKYAIVLDRRTERVIVIKLNPADFLDEEIEECDWEQILYPYEEEGKFDLTYCDRNSFCWQSVSPQRTAVLSGEIHPLFLGWDVQAIRI